MNTKRIMFFAVVVMIALSSCAVASAGWFDFGNDNSETDIVVNATTDDYFIFYSNSSSETNSTCWCGVVVNGTTYYVPSTSDLMSNLTDYSSNFKDGWIKSFVGYTKDYNISVDKNFSFKYNISEVGSNHDAHVITELFLNDD